jgi:hypothetical protein
MWTAFTVVCPTSSAGSVNAIVVAGSIDQPETPVALRARTR